MKKAFLILSICFLFLIEGESQILDVPYRSDFSGGDWCWAKTAHMIIVYHGNDIGMCDLLELRRQLDPSKYGTTDCCIDHDACIGAGYMCDTTAAGTAGLLNIYGISSTCSYSIVPSLSQVQTALGQNCPIIARQPLHVKLIYGCDSGNLYIHNPGQGSEIINYNTYINHISDPWKGTLETTTPATTCPLVQHVTGRLKESLDDDPFIYKAQQDMYISCFIESTAEAEFFAGDDVIIEGGFIADSTGSFILHAGATIICP